MRFINAFIAGLFAASSIALGEENEAERSGNEPPRPNILWITAEDMSPTLGCYGDPYATTPNLDRFAKESVRYTHAFAVSPVCSPSRSCLITGVHPVTLGTHQMRSAFPLPSEVLGFPAFLREGGYFCTNNVKTDYNTADADRLVEESWDESSAMAHWRDSRRQPNQPFFAVFNDMVSHQSRTMVWPYETFRKHVQSKLAPEEIHDSEKAPLPPYYPDTPIVRRTVARYYDCVTLMDKNVGRILAELETDGLADDTIVFFYSDHGSGMPRHKRNLHDSGMRVPLLIRFPKKYQHLAPANPGDTVRRMVSFVDFPPTVLQLAGVKSPGYMHGLSFLGDATGDERTYVYGSRDRIDEVFDTARSLRDARYLYIRNFQPHLSYHQASAYPDLGVIQREISRVARTEAGSLTEAQRDYVSPMRPAEEFYDCEADPQNLNNLIALQTEMTAEQQSALARFRKAFLQERSRLRDAGGLPESYAWDWVRQEDHPLGDILHWRTDHQADLQAAWKVADRVGMKSDTAEAFLRALGNGDAAQRYWAVIGLRNLGDSPGDSTPAALAKHLGDVAPCVRIETASFLASHERFREASLAVLEKQLSHPDWWVALHACRAVELMGETANPLAESMRALYARTRHGEGDANLYLAFSAGAFLERLGQPVDPWDFTPEAKP